MREPAVPDARLSVTYTVMATGTGRANIRHVMRAIGRRFPRRGWQRCAPYDNTRAHAHDRVFAGSPRYTLSAAATSLYRCRRRHRFSHYDCDCSSWSFVRACRVFFFFTAFRFCGDPERPRVFVYVYVTVSFFRLRRLHIYYCACVFLNFHASCTQRGGAFAVRILSALRTREKTTLHFIWIFTRPSTIIDDDDVRADTAVIRYTRE